MFLHHIGWHKIRVLSAAAAQPGGWPSLLTPGASLESRTNLGAVRNARCLWHPQRAHSDILCRDAAAAQPEPSRAWGHSRGRDTQQRCRLAVHTAGRGSEHGASPVSQCWAL